MSYKPAPNLLNNIKSLTTGFIPISKNKNLKQFYQLVLLKFTIIICKIIYKSRSLAKRQTTNKNNILQNIFFIKETKFHDFYIILSVF